MNVSVVMLAAGRGSRMGVASNKAYLRIGGRSVLSRALAAFDACAVIDEMILVIGRQETEEARAAAAGVRTPVRVVYGGAVRRESALAGVRVASGEITLIHDAARPFVDAALIERVIDATAQFGAAVPVVPEVDTLRYVVDGQLRAQTVDRFHLVKMQTPQGFRTSVIREWLERCDVDLPDDAAALLDAGIPVHAVSGDPRNIKLTTPQDLVLAEAILATG